MSIQERYVKLIQSAHGCYNNHSGTTVVTGSCTSSMELITGEHKDGDGSRFN